MHRPWEKDQSYQNSSKSVSYTYTPGQGAGPYPHSGEGSNQYGWGTGGAPVEYYVTQKETFRAPYTYVPPSHHTHSNTVAEWQQEVRRASSETQRPGGQHEYLENAHSAALPAPPPTQDPHRNDERPGPVPFYHMHGGMDNKHIKRAVQNPFLPLGLPIDMQSASDESDSGEEEDNDTEEEDKFVKRQRLSTSCRSSGVKMDEVHGFFSWAGVGGGGGGGSGVFGVKGGRFPLRHLCKEGCLDKLKPHVESFSAMRKKEGAGKPDLKRQNDMLLKIMFDDKGQCMYHSDCILRAFGISKGRLRRLRDRQQNNMAGNTAQHGLCGRRSNNSKRPETLQQFIDYVSTHRSVDHLHPQSKKPVYRLAEEMRCIQGDNKSSLRVRFNLHQQTLAENMGEKNRESISSGTAQAWFKRYFTDTLKPCEGRTGSAQTSNGQWIGDEMNANGGTVPSPATDERLAGGNDWDRSGGHKRPHHKTHGGATLPLRRISRTESGGGRDSRQSVPENSSSGGEGEGGSNNGSSTNESGNSSGNNDSSTRGGSYQSSNSNNSTDRSATSQTSNPRQEQANNVAGSHMQYAGDGFDGLRALTEAAMSVLSEAADRAAGSPWSGGSSQLNSSGNGVGNRSNTTNSSSECVQGQSLFVPAQQTGKRYRPVSPGLD